MAKFYTGQGDDGTTGILGKDRIPKHDLRMEAIGTVDEASAAIGIARSQALLAKNQSIMLSIQRDLYQLMTELATTAETAAQFHFIDENSVSHLEDEIADLERDTRIPREFIVPGDSPAGAAIDLARAIVRRAERRVAEVLARGDVSNGELLRFLNRLSSLLFLLELSENAAAGCDLPTLAKE
jgi:cob(I)alamin adenosyltransferase